MIRVVPADMVAVLKVTVALRPVVMAKVSLEEATAVRVVDTDKPSLAVTEEVTVVRVVVAMAEAEAERVLVVTAVDKNMKPHLPNIMATVSALGLAKELLAGMKVGTMAVMSVVMVAVSAAVIARETTTVTMINIVAGIRRKMKMMTRLRVVMMAMKRSISISINITDVILKYFITE